MWSILLILGLLLQTPVALRADDTPDREWVHRNQRLEAHLMLNLFRDLVAQGGIRVYDKALTAEEIFPVSVAYTYSLPDDEVVVNIHSQLRTMIPVPDVEDVVVHALTVVFSVDGELRNVVYHVCPADEAH